MANLCAAGNGGRPGASCTDQHQNAADKHAHQFQAKERRLWAVQPWGEHWCGGASRQPQLAVTKVW